MEGVYRKTDTEFFVPKSTECFNMDLVDNDTNLISNNKEPDEKYDPYEHRDVKHPVTYFDTLIHLMKASLGTGILAMPSAFKSSGFIPGTLGTMIIGMLCTYTIHLLVSSSYELCSRRKVPNLTYPDTSAAAFEDGPGITQKFAPFARFLTKLFLVSYQMGSSCVYIVFISNNIKLVTEHYFGGDTHVRWYMLYILVPLVCISWIRHLKLLAPFSSFANFMTTMSFAGIFYYIFRETPSFSGCDAFGSVSEMPNFFNIVLFAMEAIGMILPLENEMKNPRKFGSPLGVLNIAMLPITLLYTVVGLFGYMKFGKNTLSSITLNLPKEEKLAQGIQIFLSIAIYIGYALSNYVAFDIMWSGVQKGIKDESKIFWEYGLRTGIVLTTFILAVAIPNLGVLIGLIGALCLSFVGIALPAVINYLTFAEDHKKKGNLQYGLFCFRNLVIVLVATFALIVGVYVSVLDIIKVFAEGS